MVLKMMSVAIFAVGAMIAAPSGAGAAMPVTPWARAVDVVPASFWARPYPDGYTGWRRCPLVRVQTEYGWYWERLCAAESTEPVLRRAY